MLCSMTCVQHHICKLVHAQVHHKRISVNMQVHYCETAPEIVAQTDGKLSAFVMGAGTGGTLAGVSLYLKKHLRKNRSNASVQVFLVDPPGSSLSNKVKHGVCYAAQQSERTVKRHRYLTH
jgi:cysteine synthase